MVEFAGYEMPLNYEGKVGENIAGGPGEYFYLFFALHTDYSVVNLSSINVGDEGGRRGTKEGRRGHSVVLFFLRLILLRWTIWYILELQTSHKIPIH